MNPPRIDEQHWRQNLPWLDRDDADIAAYIDGLSECFDFDLAGALERWRRDGMVVFEQVVDHALIDALLGDVEYLRRHHRDFQLSVELRGAQGEIQDLSPADLDEPGLKFNSIQTISHAAASLSLTRTVAVFLAHVFGGPPCALQSLTFYKGSQQPIHVDFPYVRCQSPLPYLAASWVPLEDIHPDAGPLAYYPGSHRPDVSGFFDWGGGSIVLEPDSQRKPIELSDYLQQQVEKSGIAPQTFCPRKGDVLIWHGNLSHAGSAIRDHARTRKSYVTHYTSLAAYPPAHRHPGDPAAAARLHANGGYVFEYPWLQAPRQLPSAAMVSRPRRRFWPW